MTIGIGYHLAPWVRDGHPENLYRGLDEISLAGYDGVEIAGAPLQMFGDRPQELRRLLELHGLVTTSVYSSFGYLDSSRQSADEDQFRRNLEIAAELKSEWVLLDGGRLPKDRLGGDFTDDDVQVVADTAQRFAQRAEEFGLSLAWHQHWGGMFECPTRFHQLMSLTDPALVKFCPDTAQLHMSNFDVSETFARYADRIGFVHFKDLDLNRSSEVTAHHGGPGRLSDNGGYGIDSRWRMVELGRGLIDFPALFRTLVDSGFEGWVVDDMDYTGYPAFSSAVASREYLRQTLGLEGRREQ